MSMEQYVCLFSYPNLHNMNVFYFCFVLLPYPLIALNLSLTNFTILMNARQKKIQEREKESEKK